MSSFVPIQTFIALFLSACFAVSAAKAEGAHNQTITYTLSVAHFPIAQAKLSVQTKKKSYTTRLTLVPLAIGHIFNFGEGTVQTSGRLTSLSARPEVYDFSWRDSKEPMRVHMNIANGHIRQLHALPALRAHPERIPLTARHRQNILDPLSAMMIPLRKEGLSSGVCQRRIPIFDGWSRYDIAFSYVKRRPIQMKGYSGEGIVCQLRWIPVAGHRPNRKSVRFMAQNKDIYLWLMPLPESDIVIPSQISIRTGLGTLQAKAVRLEDE